MFGCSRHGRWNTWHERVDLQCLQTCSLISSGEPSLALMCGPSSWQAHTLKDNMKHLRKLVMVLHLWTGSKVSDAGWSGSNSTRNDFHLMCDAVPGVFSTFSRSLLFTCSLVMQLLELWLWRTKKMEGKRKKKKKRRINVWIQLETLIQSDIRWLFWNAKNRWIMIRDNWLFGTV